MPGIEIDTHFIAVLKKFIIKRREAESYSSILQ